MKKYQRFLLAIFVILFSSLQSVGHSAAQDNLSNRRLIIKFTDSTSPNDQTQVLSNHKLTKKQSYDSLHMSIAEIPSDQDQNQLVSSLKKNSKIEYVEIDDLVSPAAKPVATTITPNDPSYKSQWYLPKIQAPNAWYRTLATGVILGVCDSGVEAAHPDLSSALISSLGYNTVDNTTNWTPITDHGTKVSGVIAATNNNKLGIAGIAWGAKIIPVRISNLSTGNAYVSDAVECLTYLADHGAKAANLSYSMSQYSAIETAAQYGNARNMVTVVSASNDATNPGWTDHPSFLAVSATDQRDQLASFSNYGAYVDLAAPGVYMYTTNLNKSYAYVNGTSFSAPTVVGTLGLIFKAKPTLTAAQATSILLSTTDDLGTVGEDFYFGTGRVNAYKAVTKAQATP